MTSTFQFSAELARHEFEGSSVIPVQDRRLEMVNLAGIRTPFYQDRSLWFLVMIKGVCEFASDLQTKNRASILDRSVTEAAWVRAVTKAYKKWDPRSQAAKGETKWWEESKCAALAAHIARRYKTDPGRMKLDVLEIALDQMKEGATEKFWKKKDARFGPINIRGAWDPMTPDEEARYRTWLASLGAEAHLPSEYIPEPKERDEYEECMRSMAKIVPQTEGDEARWARWMREDQEERAREKREGASYSKDYFAEAARAREQMIADEGHDQDEGAPAAYHDEYVTATHHGENVPEEQREEPDSNTFDLCMR